MDAMFQTVEAPGESTALNLGRLLSEHRGGEVMVLDLRTLDAWTDFFVIATVTSTTHLQGLERHIKDFSREQGIEILRRSRRAEGGDEWCLIDLGSLVIHLMTARAREFYELERLWGAAPVIYRENGTAPAPSYSSKSS